MIATVNIELVVLKFSPIIRPEASNSDVAVLVSRLKALESGKGFAFLIDNLDFRTLVPVI